MNKSSLGFDNSIQIIILNNEIDIFDINLYERINIVIDQEFLLLNYRSKEMRRHVECNHIIS